MVVVVPSTVITVRWQKADRERGEKSKDTSEQSELSPTTTFEKNIKCPMESEPTKARVRAVLRRRP